MGKIYSVTEFSKIIKRETETNSYLQEVFIGGELSSVTYYKSGHLYFNLKDKDSQIKCVAFNYRLKKIPDNLKEGDSVKIFCDVGFYEARGEMQLLVRYIEKENKMGELFLKLENLKKDMEKLGYFNLEHKKKLPKFPKNIGVVTSFSGAALQDIIKTIKKRDNRINIYVYPAKVQGYGSGEEIIKGIETLDKIEVIDLIIAGRGGGSVEDLWSFNEKEVALAFYDCKKPIISAVGHEIDNLLSDLTADKRATTPTGAVEMSVPEKKQLIKDMSDRRKKIFRLINAILDEKRVQMDSLKNDYYLKSYPKDIKKHIQDLLLLEEKLKNNIKNKLKEKENALQFRLEKIIGLNPIKILSLGYSITSKDGTIIKNPEILKVGDEITTKVEKGWIKSIVKELEKND
ncbi:MAG: exodeoxyribonuclease VII large subunit [Fusobacteriaceae bacterium]